MPGRHLAPRETSQPGRHRQSHRSPRPSWRRPGVAGGVGAAAILAAGSVWMQGVDVDAAASSSDPSASDPQKPPSLPDLNVKETDLPLLRVDRSAMQVSRAASRDQGEAQAELVSLSGCDTTLDLTEGPNGGLDTTLLCELPQPGEMLQPAAAEAWWQLSFAYRNDFGVLPCVTDSYRSLDEQYAVAAAKPGLAAEPGKSNHGLGVALDLCGGVNSGYGPQYDWFQAHAAEYGWVNPDWAQPGGSLPEPWHWEYAAAADTAAES